MENDCVRSRMEAGIPFIATLANGAFGELRVCLPLLREFTETTTASETDFNFICKGSFVQFVVTIIDCLYDWKIEL